MVQQEPQKHPEHSDAQNPQQEQKEVNPVQPGNRINPIVAVLTLLAITIVGYAAWTRGPSQTQSSPTPTPSTGTAAGSATPFPTQAVSTNAGDFIRRDTQPVPSSWNTFTDARGYAFSYPDDWTLSQTNGEAHQVSNWNPDTVTQPGPLSGDQSKWDISFQLQSGFTDIQSVIRNRFADLRIESVEQSSTVNDMDVYFINGTGSLFGNEDIRVPVIGAVFTDGDQYFLWHAIFSGKQVHAGILKSIAESLTVQ